ANFGIIREKIAEMASRIYAAECTMLRTAGSVNEAVHAGKENGGGGSANLAKVMMGALREFNVECAIEKVHGSEALAYVVDEAVQIHGGYGFIEEYPVARFYRDARIARLYEGTNEINRMQIGSDILKRVGGGQLTLDPAVETNGGVDFGAMNDIAEQVRRAKSAVARLVNLVVKLSGGAASRRGGDQELLQRLADMMIAIY
ncbi:acyl-CoA dehydrogenase, partial [Candidatus Sumerlaeota bacterium]|nr:acyl-CoA dehydrogenase [Candidatus Sumerlaeota bacterium]